MKISEFLNFRSRGRRSPDETASLRGQSFVLGTIILCILMAPLFAIVRSLRRDSVQADPAKATDSPDGSNKEMPSHYEKPHLPGRPFVIGAIAFFILMLVLYAVVWGLLDHWMEHAWPYRESPSPPFAESRWNTQAPQVQADPGPDLARLRQVEYRRLHTQRWIDASHAYASIPIEDAMKLLAQAAAVGQLTTVLPAPQPATPLQLQDQKSREGSPLQIPNP